MKIFMIVSLFLLVGCTQEKTSTMNKNPFLHGVASGDPSTESVVLWTKLSVDDGFRDSVDVNVFVSDAPDKLFAMKKGKLQAHKSTGYSIRLVVDTLQSGKTYYYAFSVGDFTSPVGRTRTLPNLNVDKVKLAFVSCGHYETGYFNAYRAIAKMDDLNAVVHLGDYIYEGGVEYPKGLRQHEPSHKIVSLEDYRTRYGQYRSDEDLQELHRRHPVINIWDDHEVSDNWYKDGSHKHDSLHDGSWEIRKLNAQKAFFEWIPTRISIDEPMYRSFQLGNLANLILLDTRSYRSGIATRTDQRDSLELLGADQFKWLEHEISKKNMLWKILGNQIPFAKMDYYTFYPEWEKSAFDKWWYGYPRDYERVVGLFDKNVLVATGDVHSSFLSNIIRGKDTIAKEFITTSVSSYTWDKDFKGKKVQGVAMTEWVKMKMKEFNPHIEWFDIENNGFLILTLTGQNAVVEWYAVSIKDDERVGLQLVHKATIAVRG